MDVKGIFEQYRGFRYSKRNISILVSSRGMTKKDSYLSEKQLIAFGHSLLKFKNSIEGWESQNTNEDIIYQPNDFENIENQIFFKYVSDKVLKESILKGVLQLGSIDFYRETENQNIKDRMEGYSHLVINSTHRQFLTTLISGFNFYILCGTINPTMDIEMTNKYGQRLIKILNLNSFAKAIQKSIGATRYYYNIIQYSDTNIFKITNNLIDLETVSSDLNEDIFDFYYKYSFLPSLFIKPAKFSPDKEVRLVFEMPKDTKKLIRLSNKGLLNYIEIVK
jgi:hypothetical protein